MTSLRDQGARVASPYDAAVEAQVLVIRQIEYARLDARRGVSEEHMGYSWRRAQEALARLPEPKPALQLLARTNDMTTRAVVQELLAHGYTYQSLRCLGLTVPQLLDQHHLTLPDLLALGATYRTLLQGGLMTASGGHQTSHAQTLAERCPDVTVELLRRDGLLSPDNYALLRLGPRALFNLGLNVERLRRDDVLSIAALKDVRDLYTLADWRRLGLTLRDLKQLGLNLQLDLARLNWTREQLTTLPVGGAAPPPTPSSTVTDGEIVVEDEVRF